MCCIDKIIMKKMQNDNVLVELNSMATQEREPEINHQYEEINHYEDIKTLNKGQT